MEAVLRKLRYLGQTPVLAMRVPEELAALPTALAASGSRVDSAPDGAYAWSIVFVKSLAETAEVAGIARSLIEGDGILWIAYPKKSSKRYSADVNRDSAWPLFHHSGTRLVAQVAIDEDWSAMRLRRSEFVIT
jgi:hypothetical protein